jgi:peptidoglycan-associated lipoprotein
MKTANFVSQLLLAAILAASITGCKKTPKSPTPIFSRTPNAPRSGNNLGGIETPGTAVPSGSDPRGNIVPGSGNPDGQNALGPREELGNFYLDREAFKQQTVYFEYDRYNVKPSEISKVQSVASQMKSQPSEMKLLIEGHCDERGTPEYNRALGERRALSVRESLINLGLSGDRIQTISYGEDKPADSGHDTAAWAKNRRAEFVLLKPKAGVASDGR